MSTGVGTGMRPEYKESGTYAASPNHGTKKQYAKTALASAVSAATLLAVCAGVPTALAANESDVAASDTTSQPQLVASYDFTGGSTKDTTGHYDITLQGGAKVEKYGDRNNNEALSLRGGSQYAQLPDSLFADLGNSFTMEFTAKSRHDDDRHHFTFAVGKDKSKYLAYYMSTTNFRMIISDNMWNNEHGIGYTDVSNNNNIWHNWKLAVDGTKMAVYRDGQLVGFNPDTTLTVSDIGNTVAYIGKSPYGSDDKNWDGAMDDIRFYKGADINISEPQSVSLSGEGVVDGKLTLPVDETAKLTATVSPEDAYDTSVQWKSSDPNVVTVDNGTLTAVAPGVATITATTKLGGKSASVAVTVKDLDDATRAQVDLDKAISQVKTTTSENLPLVAHGKHNTSITWKSANEQLISGTKTDYKAPAVGAADPFEGAGVVTRPAYGKGNAKTTLTATVTAGDVTRSKDIEVTVLEHTRAVPDGAYAAVTFLSDAASDGGKVGEALYESATDGNNFFSFSQINNGNPVIVSKSDTKGLRDPYVLKSKDGDKFYMIATDLKVSSQGWGQNQQYGSLKIEAWESTDMVNWVRTNAEDGDFGIKVNDDNAGMTWAPEAFWDDSLGAYVVFFSTREYTDNTRTEATTGKNGYAYNELRYVITRDFRTFTEPTVQWQDTGYSRIDSTVFKIGDYYYRLTKNEESGAAGEYIKTGKSTFLERSKVLTAPTTQTSPNNDPETSWQLLDEKILPFEGPEAIKLNAGDPNQNAKGDAMVIMADSSGYQPYMTSESDIASHNWNNRLSLTEGWHTQKVAGPGVTGYVFDNGMPTPKRHGAFVNVPAAVATNMHRWSAENPTTIDAVDSTTTVIADGQQITATVAAADKGTVAGNVVFSADGWSETVALNEQGVATAMLPASLAGKKVAVHAAYDGYTDGLVKASESSLEVSVPDKGDSGNTEQPGKDDGAQTDPSDPAGSHDAGKDDAQAGDGDHAFDGHGSGAQAGAQSQSEFGPLASTGSVVAVVVVAMVALAGVGIAMQLLRKRVR
ncbi:arabinosidase [Galliscardovia ingluviei]|uniref:Arabinosidase n=1 Tax=Galliscardovia ingluviei TaxID=1769422 RepID=A0A8J3F2J8_9BIFI|nr:LamG-like jellyroll fold domain-containing protein [Galliscardovia ingluviei]GGI14571.1 arabinosidase [Galliscardovia ingluviei]